jgi:sulfatase modifying factor 1
MKVLINTVFSFILLGLASCQVEEVTTTPKAIAEGSKSITTSVKMIKLEGGKYKPFFGTDTSIVQVEPFYMDERPVTNGEFLEFVKAYPEWRRSNVKRIYADSNYLKIWESDTSLPDSISKDAPITQVSWHAAKAYASAVGKRLPLLDEWEFVAMADQNSANARDKKSYSDDIIDLYLIKNRQFNPSNSRLPTIGAFTICLIWSGNGRMISIQF